MVGFGSNQCSVVFYIANRPDIDGYRDLNQLRSLAPGEIDKIVQVTGNHWRKIFNVSAKFMFQLLCENKNTEPLPDSWQEYRDTVLYQSHSPISLLFSPPMTQHCNMIHIVAGRTYASELGLTDLIWIDELFAISESRRLIVCPYLDYRQLSNVRITRLIELVKTIQASENIKP
ncbi:MAG: DUF6942 family protein [Neptuniibacter sp.]